ncbi:MAG TPA: PilZ domain-containing protein [Gammaproteobacteria bacterium]|nr:PilZ domain-containing protein [Gammaproteobacteria bacterium]
MTKDNERREYFRIEDQIYLTTTIIDEDEYNAAPETLRHLDNNSFSLSADFATLNNNINPVLNNIKQIHPDIAEYVEFLNAKIDSLSQILLCKESSFDENKLLTVNISASGLMYNFDPAIDINQAVKLELVLLPEKIGIIVYGRVIKQTQEEDNTGSDSNPEHGKFISVEFEHIRDKDHELMIKHNLNKQMSIIRDQKDNE